MSETLRVGVNARTFAVEEPGGAVQAAIQLVRAIEHRDDTEVVLFGHPRVQHRFPELPLDTTGYIVNSQLYGAAWERTVLPRRASLANVDVLLAPNGNGPAHETPYPTVVWVHDVNAIQGHSAPAHRLYRRATLPRAVKAADAVTTISTFSKDEITTHLPVGPDDVHVVQNGLASPYLDAAGRDTTDASTQPRRAADGGRPPLDALDIDLPSEYVLFVGSLNPRKNVTRLLEAFASLRRDTDLPHELVLAGPAPKRIFQQLEVDLDEDATTAVTTLGFVPDRLLRSLYADADAFAFPSLYEGFGLPPLEAMAMGTPVVTSNQSSMPEVCGDAARFVDPHAVESIRAGIEDVLTDDALSAELVARGRDRAQGFTWDRAAEQFATVAADL